MRTIGLAGWSGAGKTTLLVKLLPVLARRGLIVSTVKHAHHDFDIDRPGKDSFEHRKAGAKEVLVASGTRWALMHEHRDDVEPPLTTLLGRLSPCDFVIVEGFKRDNHHKIEVHRTCNGKPLLYPDDPAIIAIVTDAPLRDVTIPLIDTDDVDAVADLIVARATPFPEGS